MFFVKRNAVHTPCVDCGMLNGITRQKVIEIIRSRKLILKIGKFKLKELLSADEAFITSSLMEVMPLVEVDGKPINSGRPGGITLTLHKAYKQLVN